jgi:hypothetical protein
LIKQLSFEDPGAVANLGKATTKAILDNQARMD